MKTLSFLATESIVLDVTNGTNEDGAKEVVSTIVVKARVEQGNSVVYTKEGEKITLSMKLFIFEQFEAFPDDLSGFCTVYGNKYDIFKGSKKRNPDGSINHIVVELM